MDTSVDIRGIFLNLYSCTDSRKLGLFTKKLPQSSLFSTALGSPRLHEMRSTFADRYLSPPRADETSKILLRGTSESMRPGACWRTRVRA